MTTIVQRQRARGARARHNNKLSPAQIIALRKRYADGIRSGAPGPTMKELAAMYRISEEQVARIVNYIQWRDIP